VARSRCAAAGRYPRGGACSTLGQSRWESDRCHSLGGGSAIRAQPSRAGYKPGSPTGAVSIREKPSFRQCPARSLFDLLTAQQGLGPVRTPTRSRLHRGGRCQRANSRSAASAAVSARPPRILKGGIGRHRRRHRTASASRSDLRGQCGGSLTVGDGPGLGAPFEIDG